MSLHGGFLFGSDSTQDQATSIAARISNPAQFWSVPIRGPVTCLVACGGESSSVLVAFSDGTLNVFEVYHATSAPRMLSSLKLSRAAICIACDAASSHAFVGTGSRDIERLGLDVEIGMLAESNPDDDGLPIKLIGHVRGAVTALAAANGTLYSAGNDGTIRMWDCRSCAALGVLASDVTVPCSLAVQAEGGLIVSASHDGGGAISVWRVPTLIASASGLRERCLAPVASALGKAMVNVMKGIGRRGGDGTGGSSQHGGSLFGAGAGGGLKSAAASEEAAARESASGGMGGGALECVHTFTLGGTDQVHTIVLAPGGVAALSASHTGGILCWDLERMRHTPRNGQVDGWEHEHFGHRQPIRGLAMLGDALVTAANDRMLHVARCPPVEVTEGETTPGDSLHGGRFGATSAEWSQGGGRGGGEDIESVLRGIESAADELETAPFTYSRG